MPRGAVCINNLKQIGLAFELYSNDYDGWIPWMGYDECQDDGGAAVYWDQLLQLHMNSNTTFSRLTGIWKCPTANYTTERQRSYGLNATLHDWYVALPDPLGSGAAILSGNSTLFCVALKQGRIKQPANTFIAVEGGRGNSVIPGTYTIYYNYTSNPSASFANIHSGGANCLFADWHVAWYPEPFADSTLKLWTNQ